LPGQNIGREITALEVAAVIKLQFDGIAGSFFFEDTNFKISVGLMHQRLSYEKELKEISRLWQQVAMFHCLLIYCNCIQKAILPLLNKVMLL
jgi:hypothetical protein